MFSLTLRLNWTNASRNLTEIFHVTKEIRSRDVEISRVVEYNTWNVKQCCLVFYVSTTLRFTPQKTAIWITTTNKDYVNFQNGGVGMSHEACCRKCLSKQSTVITVLATEVYLGVEVWLHLVLRWTLYGSEYSASRSGRITSRWSMSIVIVYRIRVRRVLDGPQNCSGNFWNGKIILKNRNS